MQLCSIKALINLPIKKLISVSCSQCFKHLFIPVYQILNMDK